MLRIHRVRCFQLSVMHLSIYQSKNKRFVEARSNVLSRHPQWLFSHSFMIDNDFFQIRCNQTIPFHSASPRTTPQGAGRGAYTHWGGVFRFIFSIVFSFAMRFQLKFNHFSCLVLRIHLARCFQLSVMHLSIYQSKNKRFVEARSNVLSWHPQ